MSITLYKWSKVDLNDALTYYGGYKEPRLLKAGSYNRGFSDRRGNPEAATFTFEVSDQAIGDTPPRLIRGLLDGATSRYFINKTCIIRSITDAGRRLEQTPRTVAIGIIRDYEPGPELKFKFKCEDYSAKFIGYGRNPEQIPKKTIELTEFANAPAEKNADGGIGDATTAGTKTFTVPHGSITIPPCPGYVQLSDQAARVCLKGDTPNGTYGTCVDPGWIMYDGSGNFIFEGWAGHQPPIPGDTVFASPEIATVMEAAAGGDTTTLEPTVGKGAPILYGDLTDLSDDGAAQCEALYVGSYDVGGNLYHKFVIAGHAVKAITAIRLENGTTGIASLSSSVDGAGLGGPWIVPGYANWTSLIGTDLFEDINGKRFTTIYGRSGHRPADIAAGFIDPSGRDTIPISVSVLGVERTGDGTGTLIKRLYRQYKHFMLNFAFNDYQTGAWIAVAQDWPNLTPAVRVLNSNSFQYAEAISNARFPTGYMGAGIFGGPEGRISLTEAIRRFNISGGCESGFNSRSQFFISLLDEDYDNLTSAYNFTQSDDILKGTLTIKDSVADWENKVVYSHTHLYMTQKWKYTESSVEDATSIAAYEETKASDNLEYWFVRNAAQAADVAAHRLFRNKYPPRIAEFTVPLVGLNHDLGHYVSITHTDGIGPNGWEEQLLYITRHVFDTDTLTVRLTGLALRAE